jgi:hypothetical protein
MTAEIPKPDPNQACNPSDVQREILLGRQFSLAEVIGRAGGTFLKGDSPIPRLFQAIAEIHCFIDHHLRDSSGAVQTILQIWVKLDEARVSQYLNSPLRALEAILEDITAPTRVSTFYEFVRQVDVEWGRIYGERPHFQQPGQASHPDDEYTHELVRQQLDELLNILKLQLSNAMDKSQNTQDDTEA